MIISYGSVLILTLYVCRFQRKLPEIFQDVHEAYENIDGRLKAEQFKVSYRIKCIKFHVSYCISYLI